MGRREILLYFRDSCIGNTLIGKVGNGSVSEFF